MHIFCFICNKWLVFNFKATNKYNHHLTNIINHIICYILYWILVIPVKTIIDMSGEKSSVSELSVTFGTSEGLLLILPIAMLWPKIDCIQMYIYPNIQ